ncbi:HAD family hydrolase [Methanogenium cariaci]|jgi:acid phosphatase (class B)
MNKNTALRAAILMGVAILLIFSAGCTTGAADGKANATPDTSYTTVSVDEIAESLKEKGPITAGLDLDSTTFYTDSVYYYGMTNIDGPNGTNVFGDSPEQNPEFISAINNEFVGYYMPKNAAIDVVRMHRERGDRVIFITKKHSSPEERISDYIRAIFGIENPNVIFTNGTSKTPFINAEHVSVYYGDSDGDITDSQSADNCTPYRFLRNTMTLQYNDLNYSLGQYGESVVENSDC